MHVENGCIQPNSPTDITIILYSIVTSILSVSATFFTIFAPISAENWLCAGAIVVSSVSIFGAVFLVRRAVDCVHGRCGTDKYDRFKNVMLIGNGGIALCSVIPRILVYFIDFNPHVVAYVLFVSIATSVSFFYFFNYGFSNDYVLDDEYEPEWEYIHFALHVVVLAASICLAKSPNEENKVMIISCQFAFGLLSWTSIVEISAVWFDGFTTEAENARKKAIRRNRQVLTFSSCVSDTIQQYYFCLVALIALIGCFLLARHPLNSAIWITIGVTVVTCLVVTGVLYLVKFLVNWIHRLRNVCRVERYHDNLLIGFGGVTVAGLAPRIVVYFSCLCASLHFYTLLVSLISAISIHQLFVTEFKKYWKLDYRNQWKVNCIVLAVHFLVLIATIRFGMAYDVSMERHSIIVYQFLFSLLSVSSSIDFGIVMMGGVTLRNGGGPPDDIESIKIEKPKKIKVPKTKNSKFECKICLTDYNNTSRTPRMMKECGHTVCETCAASLVKNGQVTCPFCQRITVVNAPSILLPKNYALLEIIEDKY